MSGTATQVDHIELGRFVAAGTPVLSVIDDQAPWVDANPKAALAIMMATMEAQQWCDKMENKQEMAEIIGRPAATSSSLIWPRTFPTSAAKCGLSISMPSIFANSP